MIKRYEWGHSRGLMNEAVTGDFVRFTDYAAEIEKLKQENWTAAEWKIMAADWQRRLNDADRLNVKLREALAPFANSACDPPCGCRNCRAKEVLTKSA